MAKDDLHLAGSTDEASPALLAEIKAAHAEAMGKMRADCLRLLDALQAAERTIAANDAADAARKNLQLSFHALNESGAGQRALELRKAAV